ncbi:predicted protein [Sclerotinia sclerotiorum 1980 UF-70]|uniref:Uncharacterized protein n=1 Tax=Sclerotinia sclerotiorum (strain ATCC 18683 / 1980 / Ss-1) TaxID=665079 RepID=A7EY21_SCLS1|nr:predicted protein [Sclerotinia sclerotiorum 1980 UF-70]EDN94363.1 predicted protein [Sclerotinia sclerotiorum 1980 UF-70]
MYPNFYQSIPIAAPTKIKNPNARKGQPADQNLDIISRDPCAISPSLGTGAAGQGVTVGPLDGRTEDGCFNTGIH